MSAIYKIVESVEDGKNVTIYYFRSRMYYDGLAYFKIYYEKQSHYEKPAPKLLEELPRLEKPLDN